MLTRPVLAALLLVLCLFAPFANALQTTDNALRIEDKADGNLLLGAERAVLERGEIYKTIVLLWGRLEVGGEVDEVVVLSGHVVFKQGSKLHKSLVVMGGSFESEPGAEVAAENVIARMPGPAWRMLRSAGNVWRENVAGLAKVLSAFVSCIILWLLFWPLFHAFPVLQEELSDRLFKDFAKNLVLGLLGGLMAAAAFIVLLISVLLLVGILLLPFYVAALALAGTLAYAAAALWAGHRLLPPRPGKRLRPEGLLLGFLALQFLWLAPVPLSTVPVWLLWTLAWGALLRSFRLLWK